MESLKTRRFSQQETISQHVALLTGHPVMIPAKAEEDTLDHWIMARHSTRKFLTTPVPIEDIRSALSLAGHSPSNSNIQPWRLVVSTGAGRDRLANALTTIAKVEGPNIPELPEPFRHYRSDLGKHVYGEDGWGIARDDIEGRTKAVLKNYEFFDAPVAIVVSMDKSLTPADSMSVGMYVQTFLLALAERGLGSCVIVSIAGFPEVVAKTLDIDDSMEILCGIAVGYEDKGFKGNDYRVAREDVDFTTKWVTE